MKGAPKGCKERRPPVKSRCIQARQNHERAEARPIAVFLAACAIIGAIIVLALGHDPTLEQPAAQTANAR